MALCASCLRASRVIGDWIQLYNHKRPHQALRIQTPATAFELAAKSEQIPLGHYSPGQYGKYVVAGAMIRAGSDFLVELAVRLVLIV